jgi:hypothetical protein
MEPKFYALKELGPTNPDLNRRFIHSTADHSEVLRMNHDRREWTEEYVFRDHGPPAMCIAGHGDMASSFNCARNDER